MTAMVPVQGGALGAELGLAVKTGPRIVQSHERNTPMTTKSLTRVIPALTKRITPISILAGFAFCFSVEAQPNSIRGGNAPFPSFIPFSEAGGEGVAVDKVGNVYVSVSTMTAGQDWRDQVWKFSPSGEMSVLADLGAASGSSGLAVDAEGNVYTGDRLAGTVRKIGRDNVTQGGLFPFSLL